MYQRPQNGISPSRAKKTTVSNYSSLPDSPAGGRGRLLLVEDDPNLIEFMAAFLREDNFELVLVNDGRRALQRVREGVELVVLDLNLPGLDGLEVLRRIRTFSPVPVFVVSARSDGSDRVTALELGADDYLTKPFLPREMVARVKALLRRARLPLNRQSPTPLVINQENKQILFFGESVDLTNREFDLLSVLASQPGRNFSRSELLDRVWGPEYSGDQRRVDLYVSRIRAKLRHPLRDEVIRSIYGVGYRLEV